MRRAPICSQDWRSAVVTPGTPAAHVFGPETSRPESSKSSTGALRGIVTSSQLT
ncbi:hypothetical protein GCM10022214_08980 [Actinomadura miaoliensis]|uniref:DUF397 domain-containing protein n=1 Tax=Actinomadura miaoliensis TaxID=430685 RepID=A0ABP7V3M3_9ACTN